MKRIFLTYTLCAVFCASLWAQATAAAAPEADRMDDKERVALTPIVLDDNIPAGAHKQLENKMTQIAAKSGCAATANSRFIITCSADILTKDITPSAPPMHAYTVALNFYVGDGVEGRLFSSYTIECKGVGQTPDKAYINALKNVRVNDPGFKAMVDKGKKEIIAYYNTYCDIIISDAQAMVQRHEYSAAIDVLTGVPMVCEDCYRRAQDESVVAYQAWRDDVCQMALTKAQAAWATRDAKAAADALTYVPTDGACVKEADALKKEIATKLDAKERQEWEFKMRKYEDQLAAREEREAQSASQSGYSGGRHGGSAVQQALQVATDAVSDARSGGSGSGGGSGRSSSSSHSSSGKPKYQVKGKWFK